MQNIIHLIGRTGGEVEIRSIENGTKVGRFSLATSESWKDKDGNWQEETQWHNITAWRELADRIANLKKGALVAVTGKLTYRKYKDKDGNERTATDIVAATVRRLEKSDATTEHPNPAPSASAEPKTATTAAPKKPDDDLPF